MKSAEMRWFERCLLRFEQPPLSAVYRVVIGFLVFPGFSRILGPRYSGWILVLSFLGLLIALRLGPALLRKVLPFSREVKAAWADRRTLAKTYDSYQWQKLFWIGLGLGGYLLIAGDTAAGRGPLTIFAIVAGGLGLWCWRRHQAALQ